MAGEARPSGAHGRFDARVFREAPLVAFGGLAVAGVAAGPAWSATAAA